MSVLDIMKYVSKTPGNTNPAVIKSMVEEEIRNNKTIDLSDYATKEYVDNALENTKPKVYTYDGDISNAIPMEEGMYLCKVTDTVLTEEELLGSIFAHVMTDGTNNYEQEITITQEMIMNEEGIIGVVTVHGDDTVIPIIISLPQDMELFGEKGTYFVCMDVDGAKQYVSKLTIVNRLSMEEMPLELTAQIEDLAAAYGELYKECKHIGDYNIKENQEIEFPADYNNIYVEIFNSEQIEMQIVTALGQSPIVSGEFKQLCIKCELKGPLSIYTYWKNGEMVNSRTIKGDYGVGIRFVSVEDFNETATCAVWGY